MTQHAARGTQHANEAPSAGLPPELLRRVRQIEIRSRRLVDHFFLGQYKAIFRGRGMEFAGVREYQPGDEVRVIDWNVTARMGEAYVKQFTEERELTVMLAVDLSRSQAFGSTGQTKREIAAEIGAVLALSATRTNDKIGMVAFTDRIEVVVPPKKGLRHALRIVRELLYCEPQGSGTDINLVVEYLTNLLRRRSILFLMSDFYTEGYERALRVAGRRHDVIGVTVTDPRELALPNAGLIEVEDAETGEYLLIDTGDKRVRAQYAARAAAQAQVRRQALKSAQVDLIEVSTADPYAAPLIAFFKRRARHAAGGVASRSAKALPARRTA